MLSIIKFFHLICGISFFGIIIASFFYIGRSIQKKDLSLIIYSIKASYFGDAIILLCVLIQLATSFFLVSAGNFTIKIPWIFIAYHAFGAIILLWLMLFIIKKFYFSKKFIPTYSLRLYYLTNILMILIFIIIIHDAVTHSTAFEFLFKE